MDTIENKQEIQQKQEFSKKKNIERTLILIVFIGILIGLFSFFRGLKITGLTTLRTPEAANFGIYLIILGAVIGGTWFYLKRNVLKTNSKS